MIERVEDLATDDGTMKTFVHHPSHGGPHPVVLYLMDAPSIRPVLQDMARRLASAGYYVMLPYLYYRGGPFREFGRSDEDMHARRDLMATVSPANINIDANALLAEAERDPAANAERFGAVGFCMSGGLTLSLAREFGPRMTAAASIHGARLVRETPDSPHLGLEAVSAEVYMAWCADDPTAPAEDLGVVRGELTRAGVAHTIDHIDWAQHGFAPAGPRYDLRASELHWERVHDLLRRQLSVAG